MSPLLPSSGHPYTAPTVSDADITVDYMLDQPEIITKHCD